MIDKIPCDVCYIAATYLSAYDLKSLTQVSPLLRNVFSPSAWNLVYVLPKGKNGAQKKLVEYIDYRFVDEVTFVNATKYQWFKRKYVHQIVFDHWCPLLSSDIVEQMNLDQFPNLLYIKAEALPIYPVGYSDHGHRTPHDDDNHRYADRDLELVQEEENTVIYTKYPFTQELTTGACHAKYTIHLLVSSVYHWHNIRDYALITHLDLTFDDESYIINDSISGLGRCVNVEWLAIKVHDIFYNRVQSGFEDQYLNLMSTFKSLKKLRYLKTSYTFWKARPMTVFDCILNDLDNSVYYEHQILLGTSSHDLIFNNRETRIFPYVKALKITHERKLIYLTREKSQFKVLFPNLQHLSLEFIRLGDYLNDMVGSLAEGLQTLKVSVYGPPDMMWLIKTLPQLKRLRVLYLKEWYCRNITLSQFAPAIYDSTYFDWEYIENGSKYDELFQHIINGGANAPFEEIIKWRRIRVKKLVLSALGKHAKVEDSEIEYMVDLILDPEDIVTEFGSSNYYDDENHDFGEDGTPKVKYIMCYYYAVWESIFMKCQQLKELERLTIDGVWQPFLSPNFENLVCKHDTLKRVNIRVLSKTKPVILEQAKYSRFITRHVTPVTGYNWHKRERKICSFCHAYWVDVEGFRKQFAREIYKEGDYEDVEYTSLASEKYLTIIDDDYLDSDTLHNSEQGSYRYGQEASTWDFAMQLHSSQD